MQQMGYSIFDNYQLHTRQMVIRPFAKGKVEGSTLSHNISSKIWNKQVFPPLHHMFNSIPLKPLFLAKY